MLGFLFELVPVFKNIIRIVDVYISENVDDDQTYMLCKGITGKIEENLTYPGQIRVTVIRERRAVGYAK